MNATRIDKLSTIFAALVVSSCQESTADFTFSSFEIVDITSSSARVRFTTSRESTCEIEYGVDKNKLDRRATDPSMDPNDPFSVDHDVVVTNLDPLTTYYFRASARDHSDSRFYSDISDFATARAQRPLPAENVALASAGTTVSQASSFFGPGWEPERAIDGDINTEWASSGDGDNASIELEFDGTRLIAAVAVFSRQMADGSSIIRSFHLEFDDGSSAGPFDVPDATTRHSFDIVPFVTTRTVKLVVDSSSGGNTGLREFELFGPSL